MLSYSTGLHKKGGYAMSKKCKPQPVQMPKRDDNKITVKLGDIKTRGPAIPPGRSFHTREHDEVKGRCRRGKHGASWKKEISQ
jgi:hypothetical protein